MWQNRRSAKVNVYCESREICISSFAQSSFYTATKLISENPSQAFFLLSFARKRKQHINVRDIEKIAPIFLHGAKSCGVISRWAAAAAGGERGGCGGADEFPLSFLGPPGWKKRKERGTAVKRSLFPIAARNGNHSKWAFVMRWKNSFSFIPRFRLLLTRAKKLFFFTIYTHTSFHPASSCE